MPTDKKTKQVGLLIYFFYCTGLHMFKDKEIKKT